MAQTAIHIACCLCGTLILPNAANQCTTCLAQQFDLKGLLQKGDLTIHQCRQCRKFARTPTAYESCEQESPELLSICLKHIPAFVKGKGHNHSTANLQILDALWVWTEPHSMRLKVRVTVRTEMEGVQIQQRVLVEFHVQFRMCPDCNREYTNRTWQALVQLRQKRDDDDRKGLATLEMALRRNKEIRKNVLRIDSCRNGLDFYFLTVPHAQTFAMFLSRLAPMRLKSSQKMVSEDNHSNTANVRHTCICDMVPLCRDDLVMVHKISRGLLSGRLALVTKVSSQIHLVDASPKRTELAMTSLHPDGYYKAGGEKAYPICQSAYRMIKFVILDVELCDTNTSANTNSSNPNDDSHALYQGPTSGVEKYALADVEVARESDFGVNDTTYHCVSHLGHLLQPGDVVLGYDLASTAATISTDSSAGVVDLEDVVNHNFVMPDVVLVKKIPSKQLDTGGNVDNDEQPLVGGGTKKRTSKRKLRRINKKDRKERELQEAAARMGFVQEHVEEQNFDDEQENGEFQEELENDPELAAELEEVERELATIRVDDNDAVLVEEEEGKEGEENVAADDVGEPKYDPSNDSLVEESL